MVKKKNGAYPQQMRYLIAALSFMLLAINGCDSVYFNAEPTPQAIQQNEKKEIRVLTLKNPLIHFQDHQRRISGIDYDLLQDFSKFSGLSFTFIEMADEPRLFEALARGEGDMVAARVHGEDMALKGFIAGPAYEETQLSLFCRDKVKVSEISDLDQKSVALLEKDSDLLIENRLTMLAPKISLQKIVNSNTQQILKMTSRGLFDCAFAEDLEGSYFLRAYPNVLRVGPVTNRYTLNWVLRPEQQELRNLMQQWFQKATRQDDIMRIQDHYRTFLSSLDVQDVRHFTERIHYVWPEYKASFKSAARHYELDWRLLGAIAFQESHWEPEARSYTGVRGLMQLTSTTAELAGIEDRTDPQESIWGGAYYFKYLYDRLPSELHVNDRTALALAAYNLGYGHLMDAQKLAVKEGRNPNSWRDIRAMLPHLADPAYSDQLDFGPARGQEALDFVERVRGYYSLWRSLDS